MSLKLSPLKVVLSVLFVGLFFFLKWLFLPPFSIQFESGFLFYGISLVAAISVISLFFKETDDLSDLGTSLTILIIGIGGIFILWVIGGFIGSSIFNGTTKYEQLGTITEKVYTDEISPIDLTQIPYVDVELARKLGDKKLGEDPTLGSQVTLGDFTMQQVNGKLVLVAPLVHTGFFKYNANKSGTPGYIVVSATNPQDVTLVQKINEQDIKLKYQINAYFNDDLKRHVRNSGFASEGLTDFSFELDDNGYPYWVITTCENTTMFGTIEATGTIVVDAMTGECQKFSIADSPAWVDIIQPKEFIAKQINNYGSLVHGWFNPSDEGKIKATDGMSTIYNNGHCYYYTGLTSYGSDDSTIGFMLVDTRTKEAIKYSMSGAHENAAMRSAEGKVPDLGYKATYPLPVNIDGVPTYFMTLKDAEGLVKMFAFVNINDYGTLGVGDTIIEAKKNYSSAYLSGGNAFAFSSEAFSYNIQGIIDRIAYKVDAGSTIYSFTLEGNDLIFLAPSNLTEELTLSQKGDTVSISYVDEKNLSVIVSAFDNLFINTRKSEDQVIKENAVNNVTPSENNITTVDPNSINSKWDQMSDEEKAKLLK